MDLNSGLNVGIVQEDLGSSSSSNGQTAHIHEEEEGANWFFHRGDSHPSIDDDHRREFLFALKGIKLKNHRTNEILEHAECSFSRLRSRVIYRATDRTHEKKKRMPSSTTLNNILRRSPGKRGKKRVAIIRTGVI